MRIATMRGAGMSFDKIAAELNASGTPTYGGGNRYYASTVRAVVA
jgi:hypothetical protein